jgi:hypothetical protein
MSITSLITNAKRNFESQSEAVSGARSYLTETERSIRLIDPQLLGEKRYAENAHWKMTRLVYDFCYFIQNLWKSDTICLLKENLERAKHNLTTTEAAYANSKQILEGLEGLLKQRVSQLSAQKQQQEEALAALDKTSEPIPNTSRIGALWTRYWSNPTQHQENTTRLAREKQALQAQIEATVLELQPLIDYTKASEIPAPVEVKPTISFDQLKIDEAQKALMMETIPVVANGSILDLIPKIPTFLRAKETLGPLHPLKSLEEILTNPTLCKCLVTISQNPTKWKGKWIFGYGQVDGFLQSTAKRLEKYHEKGAVIPYIPGFAKALGLTADQEAKLLPLATEQNWEGFVTEMAAIAAKKG